MSVSPLTAGQVFHVTVLQSESLRSMCAKLHTVAASNTRDHTTRSLYYCLFAPHIRSIVLRAHSVHGEPHIQRNVSREVATTIPLFLQRTAPITHSFWEDLTRHNLHILVTATFCCDWEAWAASAQSFTLWQQVTRDDTPWSLYYYLFAPHIYVVLFCAHIPSVVNRTFSATPAERLQQ